MSNTYQKPSTTPSFHALSWREQLCRSINDSGSKHGNFSRQHRKQCQPQEAVRCQEVCHIQQPFFFSCWQLQWPRDVQAVAGACGSR